MTLKVQREIYKNKCLIPLDELESMLSDKKSINSIAKHFGCDWTTIRARIREHPELLEKV